MLDTVCSDEGLESLLSWLFSLCSGIGVSYSSVSMSLGRCGLLWARLNHDMFRVTVVLLRLTVTIDPLMSTTTQTSLSKGVRNFHPG